MTPQQPTAGTSSRQSRPHVTVTFSTRTQRPDEKPASDARLSAFSPTGEFPGRSFDANPDRQPCQQRGDGYQHDLTWCSNLGCSRTTLRLRTLVSLVASAKRGVKDT